MILKSSTLLRLLEPLRPFTLSVFVHQSLKMLDDEETTDNELRSKFNQRWNRTPSGDLYKPLRAGTSHHVRSPFVKVFDHSQIDLPPPLLQEGANFRNILDKAVNADQVVRDRYNSQCDMIALLCKPENELNAAIPSANPTKTLQGSEVSLRTLHTCVWVFRRCKTSIFHCSS